MNNRLIGSDFLKIKTLEDINEASHKIIEALVSKQKVAIFNLLVDHQEGTVSNCAWTPATQTGSNQKFLAVEDYGTIMLLLLKHPKITELEYDEEKNEINAIFAAPELEEMNQLENPGIDYFP